MTDGDQVINLETDVGRSVDDIVAEAEALLRASAQEALVPEGKKPDTITIKRNKRKRRAAARVRSASRKNNVHRKKGKR